MFTDPDTRIMRKTYGVLVACCYQGDTSRAVVDVKDIISVVGMVPLPPRGEERTRSDFEERFSGRHFVVEKLGFDMTFIGRAEDPEEEQEAEASGVGAEDGACN